MNVIACELPGVLILEPKVFGDERGFFYESFNARSFEQEPGSSLILCRTTIHARKRACCAACTISWKTFRANWCG